MKKLLIFLLGAGAGSAITWYITKERYRAIANEEIASVVNKFKEREEEINNIMNNIPDENPNPNYQESNEDISQPEQDKVVDINSFKQIVEDEKYKSDMSEDDNEYIVETDIPEKPGPYEISEEEYNQYNDYDEKTLIYTADNMLIDEDDDLIVDPESIVGNCLNNFGVYTESMYIRDDVNKIDYIVIRSEKLYSEFIPEEE